MSEAQKPTTAFILSLIGGIFILLGGGMMSMIGSYGVGGMMNGYAGYGGMMGGYGWGYGPGFGMMRGYGYGGMFGIAGILFGVAVIAGALMLYNNPTQHSKWGLVILIFSLLSIFGSAMAGFGIGLILGLIGGILALTWKPPITEKK
ncbi:MAG: DUF6114 domain-containing protein [Candidatus Bathyarchaeia archaeon]|jgi:hypothetical protein